MSKIVTSLKGRLAKFLNLPPNYIGAHGCIHTAASFAAWNQIGGDYLEFGVWEGRSFAAAYHEILAQRSRHLRKGYSSPEYDEWAAEKSRVIAFDSFEGIPDGDGMDRMVDYQAGSYGCSEPDFLANLEQAGVNLNDVVTVKGFYDKTCTDETKEKYSIRRASIVMIDCDLYESTVPVMNFLTDIVQQGTVIIFDDWFRFKGDPNAGEQRACQEWLRRNPNIELIEHWRQGPQAMSFIVHIKTGSDTTSG